MIERKSGNSFKVIVLKPQFFIIKQQVEFLWLIISQELLIRLVIRKEYFFFFISNIGPAISAIVIKAVIHWFHLEITRNLTTSDDVVTLYLASLAAGFDRHFPQFIT